MNAFKLLVATVAAGAVMAGFATTAHATNNNTVEQEQKLNQKIELKCKVGAYGQTTECKATGEQTGEQKQKVTFRQGQVLGRTHTPVDTALDFQTSAAAVLSIGSGAGAFILNRKIG